MKICVVSRGDIDVISPKEGAAVKLHYTMTSLSFRDNEVYFVNGDDVYYKIEDGRFHEIKYPWFVRRFMNHKESYRDLVELLGIPHTFSNLYHPVFNLNLWLKTLYVTLKEEPDILQAEFPAYSFPALFSKLFTGTDVSTVEHNIEYFQIRDVAEKLSESAERAIRFVEKVGCSLSDYVVTVSEEDRNKLEELGVKSDKVIPHGVDLERFERGNGERVRKELGIQEEEWVFIYHGVLNYRPNREAVLTLVEDILPEIRQFLEDFKLLVVGGYPPEIDEPEVITTGFVEDLEDYIDAADIALVPLEAGGGTRLKIPEYFAGGVPVITTQKGVEGIEVKDGKHVIISEMDDFSENIERLLGDDELRDEMTGNASEFIKSYSWDKIGEMYEELYS